MILRRCAPPAATAALLCLLTTCLIPPGIAQDANAAAVTRSEVEVGVPGNAAAVPNSFDCNCTAKVTEALEAHRGRAVVDVEGRLSLTDEALSRSDDETRGITESYSMCRLDLAESESDRDGALRRSAELEGSIERLRGDRVREVDDLVEKIANLTRDVERHKRHLRNANDRYYDARRDLFRVDSELREMHRRAVSRYVNVTLMKEDAARYADRAAQKVERRAEEAWRALGGAFHEAWEAASPHVRAAREEAAARWEILKEVSKPHLEAANIQFQKNIAPHLRRGRKIVEDAYGEHLRHHVDPVWAEYGAPIAERLSEAKISLRLSAVSAVRQSSRALATYLELVAEEREEEEPPRPAHLPPLPRRKKTKVDRKLRRPSPRREWLIGQLRAADRNAEDVASSLSILLGAFLLLFPLREYLVAAVLFLALLPFRPLLFLCRLLWRKGC